MGPINLSSAVFHNSLCSLANPNTVIEIEGNKLTIHQGGNHIEARAVEKIIEFLLVNQNHIQKSDTETVLKLRDRLLQISQNEEDKNNIRNACLQVLSGLKASVNIVSPLVICEISKAPVNDAELLHNIHLVINNLNYVLTDSLAVIDAKSGHLPENWSKIGVYNALNRWQSEESSVQNAISEAEGLFKPRNIVSLSIVMHPGPDRDNGTMESTVLDSINASVPTLTTGFLIKQMILEKTLEPQFSDLFVQKKGGLVLLMPKGSSLRDAGFNPDSFKKLSSPDALIPQAVNVRDDLSSALLDDQKDKNFRRLIFFSGHGSEVEPAQIAGLPVQDFQASLEALKGMDFLYVQSCFAGGRNMADIALPQGIISCPIIVESSTELEAAASRSSPFLALNTAAFLKLYPEGQIRNDPAKQLTQKDMRNIGTAAFKNLNADISLMNMQSFLLPASEPTIPHAAYSGMITPGIMDIDRAVKQRHGAIIDSDPQRTIYFLSRPIVNTTLTNVEVSHPVAFASRGGNNLHIMNEVNLPNIESNSIILETIRNTLIFDYEKGKYNKTPSANKLFVIGTLRCLINGKPFELKNVVIGSTKKGSFESSTVKGFEKLPTPYAVRFFDIGDQSIASDRMHIINEEAFIDILYTFASLSMPSSSQLNVTAAGREGSREFLDHLDNILWNDRPCSKAELYSSLFQDNTFFVRNALANTLKTQNTLDTALKIAVERNNKDAIKMLVEEGAIIDTPLVHEAILAGKEDLVITLLETGFDPFLQDQEGKTAFELAINYPSLFKKMAVYHEWNRPFSDGRMPLFHALDNKSILEMLIALKVPLEEINEYGNTALQQMILNEADPKLKQVLILAGAKNPIDEMFLEKMTDLYYEDPTRFSRAINGTEIKLSQFPKGFSDSIEESIQLITPQMLGSLKVLLKAGVNFDLKGNKIQLLYLSAIKENDQEILSALEKRGFEPNPTLWADISETALLQTIALHFPKHLSSHQRERLKEFFLASADNLKWLNSSDPLRILKTEYNATDVEIKELFFKSLVSGNFGSIPSWKLYVEPVVEGRVISEIVKNPALLIELEKIGFSFNAPSVWKTSPKDNADLLCALIDRGLRLDHKEQHRVLLNFIRLGKPEAVRRLCERGYSFGGLEDLKPLVEIFKDLEGDALTYSSSALIKSGFNQNMLPNEIKEKIPKFLI